MMPFLEFFLRDAISLSSNALLIMVRGKLKEIRHEVQAFGFAHIRE